MANWLGCRSCCDRLCEDAHIAVVYIFVGGLHSMGYNRFTRLSNQSGVCTDIESYGYPVWRHGCSKRNSGDPNVDRLLDSAEERESQVGSGFSIVESLSNIDCFVWTLYIPSISIVKCCWSINKWEQSYLTHWGRLISFYTYSRHISYKHVDSVLVTLSLFILYRCCY